jgi:Na+-driven multidrug efflux pump
VSASAWGKVHADAQTAAHTGLGVGVCMAVLTAIFTVALREHIALLYNDNPEVVTLASQLMLLAGLYQIPIRFRLSAAGFCGYKDTRSSLLLYRLLGTGFTGRLYTGVNRPGG